MTLLFLCQKWYQGRPIIVEIFLKGDVALKPIPDADGSEGVAVACHAGLRVEPGHPGRPIVSFLAQLAIHARRVALEEEVVSCQSRRRLSTRNLTPRLKVFIFIEDFIHFSTLSHPASDADSSAFHFALGVDAAPLRLDLQVFI